MIVIDASALLDLVLRTPCAPELEDRVFETGEELHAPHLLDVECAQVIRKWNRSGHIPDARAVEAFEDLADMSIIRHPHGPLLERAWHLRRSITAYDAMYIALAEGLDATLLTTDARLARSHGHTARIALVPRHQN